MQIFVLRSGQQAGPYTADQLHGELRAGTLNAGDLAWYEGAPNWLPLAEVPGMNAAPPPPMYVPGAPSVAGAAPQTAGTAVASLVMGLVSLLILVTALPAVIAGIFRFPKSSARAGGSPDGGWRSRG